MAVPAERPAEIAGDAEIAPGLRDRPRLHAHPDADPPGLDPAGQRREQGLAGLPGRSGHDRGRRAERRPEALDCRRVAGDEQVEIGQGGAPSQASTASGSIQPTRIAPVGSSCTLRAGSATTVTSAAAPAATIFHGRSASAVVNGRRRRSRDRDPQPLSGPRRVAADRVEQHDAGQTRAPRPDEPLPVRPTSRDLTSRSSRTRLVDSWTPECSRGRRTRAARRLRGHAAQVDSSSP